MMQSPQEGKRFGCICGKSYNTKQSFAQHKRRHCQGPPTTDVKCQICDKTFATYPGMRQHMKRAHQLEYRMELEKGSKGKRSQWTEDEVNVLARAEAIYFGKNILECLDSLSCRTREAIKCRRKLETYKDKVAYYRNLIVNLQPSTISEEEARQDFSNEQLEEFLKNIDKSKLSNADLELLHSVLNDNLLTAQESFNNWINNNIDKNALQEIWQATSNIEEPHGLATAYCQVLLQEEDEIIRTQAYVEDSTEKSSNTSTGEDSELIADEAGVITERMKNVSF